MREIEVVAAILIQGGRVLAAQRSEGGIRGGTWEFPGGKVDPGESQRAGLERELREELSLEVEVTDLFLSLTHDYPDLRIHLHAYFCQHRAGAATALEHQSVRWLRPSELREVHWSDADRVIAEELARRLGA